MRVALPPRLTLPPPYPEVELAAESSALRRRASAARGETTESPPPSLSQEADEEGEAEGSLRVLEALQCRLWPGGQVEAKAEKPPVTDEPHVAEKPPPQTEKPPPQTEKPPPQTEKPPAEKPPPAKPEQAHEAFEKLLGKAKQLRENGDSLPVEERRERAASLAIQVNPPPPNPPP